MHMCIYMQMYKIIKINFKCEYFLKTGKVWLRDFCLC